jgi:hypothetical protein
MDEEASIDVGLVAQTQPEKKQRIRIFCYYRIFQYYEDYVNGFHDIFDIDMILFQDGFQFRGHMRDPNIIYLFYQYVPEEVHLEIDRYIAEGTVICVMNTEQLSRKFYRDFISHFHPYIHRVDYSEGNLMYLPEGTHRVYLPYQYHLREIQYEKIEKDKGICMIDPGNSPRRKAILDALAAEGIQVDLIKGFGEERDKELYRHKILINIHYAEDYMVFEELRCNRAIFNRMVVVSELSVNDSFYIFRNHLIVAPYQQMVEVIKETVTNYEKYYHILFDSFGCPRTRLQEMAREVVTKISPKRVDIENEECE